MQGRPESSLLTYEARKSPHPLRITVIFGHEVVGGGELWLLPMLQRLPAACEVDAVFLASGALEQTLPAMGIRAQTIPTGKTARDSFLSMRSLRASLKRTDPDVILCNGIKAGTLGVPIGRLLGIPTVWCKHDFVFDRSLGVGVSALADAVIATSDELVATAWRRSGNVVQPPYPGTPAKSSDAESFWADRELDLSCGKTLAMIGRLVPYKGLDTAIDALALPAATGWRLAVIGGEDKGAPGYEKQLRQRAEELGVHNRVSFLGPVAEVWQWLAAFDAVAVLTANRTEHRYSYEGFGIAALEGFSAGVPVIMTPRVPAEKLAPAATLRVGPDCPADVANALSRVSEYKPAALAAAKRLADSFGSIDARAERFFEVLSRTARRPGAGRRSSSPDLSVVSTVFNEADSLPALLQEISEQLKSGDEFLVVDAGSLDTSQEIVSQFSAKDHRVKLIVAPETNISQGRNIGVRHARNPVIAFTDAGCHPAANWLESFRVAFAGESPPDLVTGIYRADATPSAWHAAQSHALYPSPAEACKRGPWTRLHGKLFGTAFNASLPTGRSMAVTKSAWVAAGGFPEDLLAAEDVTVGRAIRTSGRECILTADAEVTWGQRDSLVSTVKMFFSYGRGGGQSGNLLLIARDVGRLSAYCSLPWVIRRAPLRMMLVGGAYLSVPVLRARRDRATLPTYAYLPLALAMKDLAKVAGCLVGVAGAAAGHLPPGSLADRTPVQTDDHQAERTEPTEPVLGKRFRSIARLF